MYVIEVIPLTILPPNVPQILSYFFDSELQKGAVVEIPLNKRKIKAVVISSNSLEKQKLSLKKVDFQVKKIIRVVYDKPQVSDYQLKLAAWIAKYYYAPLGYTLKTILPPFAFKKKYSSAARAEVLHVPTRQVLGVGHRPLLGNSVVYPQFWIYKTKDLSKYLIPLIRETLKNSKQALIVVPEKTVIDYFIKELSGQFNISVIFSGLSNEKVYDAWQKARSGETDIIIGTRQALNMHFKDLGLIIVDDPLHEFYKSDMVPRYNAVALAHKVAELNNSQLVLASVIAGVENYYKIKNGEYELKEVEPRPKFDAEIIDTTKEIKDANWSPISKKLNAELIASLKNNKRVLIFSPRRGYVGILVCGNCGSAANCPQCEVAMRTHRAVEMILVCHHCGISKPVPINCSVCGSRNFKLVGPAGTQKTYEEIKHLLLVSGIRAPVLVLDTDVVKNETEEEEIISEISNPPAGGPAVLIATQMIFSYRFCLNFDLIGITNIDALTNIPDFKSEENLFYQTETLLNFSPNKLVIQTYNPENKLIEKAALGNHAVFYENELKLREALGYPPFYQLIRISFRHKDKNKASYAARITSEKLKMAVARSRLGKEIKIIEAAPAYIEKERGLYIYNIFLKVREGYQNINELLKYVGPGWIIDVEPRSLL